MTSDCLSYEGMGGWMSEWINAHGHEWAKGGQLDMENQVVLFSRQTS